MYTIIGGDGAEYGPVTAEQIRSWIAAKRASLDTMAKAQGSEEWRRLGDFAEFKPGAEGVLPPLAAVSPEASASDIAAQILAQHGRPTIGDSFERAWELLKSDFWPILGVTALVMVAQIAAGQISGRVVFPGAFKLAAPSDDAQVTLFSPFFMGNAGLGVAIFMLFSGIYYYFLKRFRGEPATVKDAFAGFSRLALPLILAGLLECLLVGAGFLCLVLPGIYLAIAYLYTPMLILDQKLGVWTAMEVSRRLITAHWFKIFFLCIVAALIEILGAICLGVGLFVAFPIVTGAIAASYEMIVHPRRVTVPTT